MLDRFYDVGQHPSSDRFRDVPVGMIFVSWIESRVVSYLRDRKLSYDQLLPILKSAVPTDGPFAILAESSSTPLAVKCAAEASPRMRALLLCAGFVSPPRRDVLRRVH